jgi:hypothetical protein
MFECLANRLGYLCNQKVLGSCEIVLWSTAPSDEVDREYSLDQLKTQLRI